MNNAPDGGKTRILVAAASIMVSVQVTTSMAVLAAAVLVELAAPDLGVAIHVVGYYLSVLFAFGTFSALLCGLMIAKLGPVRVVQASLALTALGLAMGATGNIWMIALSCPVIGLGMGGTTPSATHLLSRLTPPSRRGLVFSLNQSGVPIGNALAGAMLPSLGLAFGWQMPLLLLAGLCLALLFAAQTQRRMLDVERVQASAPFSFRAITAPMAAILKSGPLLRAAITSGTYAGMQACSSAFLVAILTQRAGFDLVTAGAVLTASQLSGAAGRIFWGLVADRTGRPGLTLAIVGFIMTGCAIAVGAVQQDWPVVPIVLAASLLGATGIGWNGVFLAEVARLAPAGKVGAVAGATSMYTFSGVWLVPSLFALIVDKSGSYQMGFMLAAAISAAGALMVLPWLWSGKRA